MDHHMTYDKLGDILAARREELGLTQAEVAERLGYDNPSFISMLEGGRSKVPPERAFDFCAALDLPRLWFFDRVLRDREDLAFIADWLFGPGGRLRTAYLADAALSRGADSERRPAHGTPAGGGADRAVAGAATVTEATADAGGVDDRVPGRAPHPPALGRGRLDLTTAPPYRFLRRRRARDRPRRGPRRVRGDGGPGRARVRAKRDATRRSKVRSRSGSSGRGAAATTRA